MKKMIAILVLAAAAGCTASSDPADSWTREPVVVPFMKIGRGVTNIVVSPLDIPATVVRVRRDTNDFGYAMLAGTTEGIGNCVVRILAGVVEILTFPIVTDPEPFYSRPLGARADAVKRDPIPIDPGIVVP